MNRIILSLASVVLLTACSTTPKYKDTNSPPKHTQNLGQTTATYLEADYSVSFGVIEGENSVHITLSCSPESSLSLINLQHIPENPFQMFALVMVQTTHATSVGKFYYNDDIPITGKFIPVPPNSSLKRLFTSDKLTIYCEGEVTLSDDFKKQLHLITDDPKAFSPDGK